MQTASVVEQKTGPHILVRAVWYVFVGWWLTGLVIALAWLAAVLIVGLPLTFWLVNRIPTILTLRPRRERYAMATDKDGVLRYQRVATEQTNLLVRIGYFLLMAGGRQRSGWS